MNADQIQQLLDTDVIKCPVDGCTWCMAVEKPDPRALDDNCLASVFGVGVMAACARNEFADKIDRSLRAHVRSHSIDDWLRTVCGIRERWQDAFNAFNQATKRATDMELMVKALLSKILTVKDQNTHEWMDWIVEEINKVAESLGETQRVERHHGGLRVRAGG